MHLESMIHHACVHGTWLQVELCFWKVYYWFKSIEMCLSVLIITLSSKSWYYHTKDMRSEFVKGLGQTPVAVFVMCLTAVCKISETAKFPGFRTVISHVYVIWLLYVNIPLALVDNIQYINGQYLWEALQQFLVKNVFFFIHNILVCSPVGFWLFDGRLCSLEYFFYFIIIGRQ